MTESVTKICNFVHDFFREGGYQYCDQFSLLLFSLFMVGGGDLWEIVPNSLYSVFLDCFPNVYTLGQSKVHFVLFELYTGVQWYLVTKAIVGTTLHVRSNHGITKINSLFFESQKSCLALETPLLGGGHTSLLIWVMDLEISRVDFAKNVKSDWFPQWP